MSDPFKSYPRSREMPARKGFSISTHNTNDLANVTRGIMIGGGSTMSVVFADDGDTPTTLSGLVPGQVYPFAVKRVRTTGTDATGIVGFL
jgi:hypothetical protein